MQTETSRKYRFWVYALLIILIVAAPLLLLRSPAGQDDGELPQYWLPGAPNLAPERPVMAFTDAPSVGEVTISAPETEPPLVENPDDPLPDETDSESIDSENEPEETEIPEEDPDSRPHIPRYDHQIAPSDPVTDEYFKDALFIGDSRVVGLCAYAQMPGSCYAQASLNIKSVLTNAFLPTGKWTDDGLPIYETVFDALKRRDDHFTKVYIGFGVNEYGYSPAVFSSCYEYFLDRLTELLPPEAEIYVLGIFPVNDGKAAANGYAVKNERLLALDGVLAELCVKRGAHYLNVSEAVGDNGRYDLPPESASDGVHLNFTPTRRLKEYIYAHTVPEIVQTDEIPDK